MSLFPITVMLEYNPDQYDRNVASGGSRPTSPWSAGFTWHALPGVDLRLSVQHGDEIGVGFRSYLLSKTEFPRREPEQFVSSYYLPQSDLPPQINKNRWYDRLLYDVERSGLLLVEGTIAPDGQQASLVVGNPSYALWSDAIGRHTALADLHLPATVKDDSFCGRGGRASLGNSSGPKAFDIIHKQSPHQSESNPSYVWQNFRYTSTSNGICDREN